MTVLANGDVGIGTTSPVSKLHVQGGFIGVTTGQKIGWIYNPGSDNNMYNYILTADNGGVPASHLEISGANWTSGNTASVKFTHVTGGDLMTIMTGGYVGIGTASPVSELQVGDHMAKNTITIGGFYAAGGGVLAFRSGYAPNLAYIWNTAEILATDDGSFNGRIEFKTSTVTRAAPTIKMVIKAGGNVGVNNTIPDAYLRVDGTTSVTAARFYGTGGTRPPLELRQNNTAGWFAKFYSDNFGTYVGGISFYGSTTTFSTSSDYRLKENIIPISDSITRLKQLKPSRFNFKQYPEITIDGFLAHEVQDIVPEAITGDKDELDLNGKPVYQAIDHSRLIPLLVASIQELELRVKELENK
jgi:hypothetical protein